MLSMVLSVTFGGFRVIVDRRLRLVLEFFKGRKWERF